jgi:hypothetical protein
MSRRVSFDEGEPPQANLWSVKTDGSELTQLTEAEDLQMDGAVAGSATAIDASSAASCTSLTPMVPILSGSPRPGS